MPDPGVTRFTKKTQLPRDKKTQIGNWKKIPIRIPASGKPEKNLHCFSTFSIIARKFIFFRPQKWNFRGKNCGRKTIKKIRNFFPFFFAIFTSYPKIFPFFLRRRFEKNEAKIRQKPQKFLFCNMHRPIAYVDL